MAGVGMKEVTGDSSAADAPSDAPSGVTNWGGSSAMPSPTITISSSPGYVTMYQDAEKLNHKADIIHELVVRNIDFEMYTAEDEVFTIIKWGKKNG